MKKFLLLVVVMLAGLLVSAQVQRNVVILEIGTGTWCTYCPGAANGAQQLLNTGAQVAVIEYHNGDPFTNNASNARNSYYGITGYPTANFDGVTPYVGGQACPSGNVYASYLPLYNAAYAVASPLVIDISGTNNGNTYNVVLSIKKLAAVTGTTLKAHLVLTETDIATAPWPGSGGCMTSVHDVERMMVPDENGTDISFTSGDMQIVTLQFTKDPTWVLANCELVAFVQDNSTKTIYNGAKVALNALPAPIPVDFIGSPLAGCAPVSVNFTDQSVGVTNWQWSCPGGSPVSPTTQNPTVVYNTTGSYDVTLTAWNNTTNRGNKKVRTAYVNPTATPAQATQPSGSNGLCNDPPNQSYSTAPVAGALSYTWDLQPPTAGTIIPGGTSCTVDFSNTFSGTAQLKVRASNTCGDGPWSTALSITLSPAPGIPGTPTGPTWLCLNPNNSTYNTTGTTPATSYYWELLPTTAGNVSGTSSSCIVDWSTTWTGTATLKVKAINNGCEGPWSSDLSILIDNGPSAYIISGGGTYCATTGTGLPVEQSGSETGINYTLYKDGNATSNTVAGTGSPISFGNQTAAGTYTVVANNPLSQCNSTMSGNAVIAVDPEAPGTPATPQGPAQPNAGTSTDYTTTGGQYATTYSWEVTPTNAGVFTGNTTTGSIDWNSTYTGPAQITVTGVNTCGSGTESTAYEVVVLPPVGTGDLSGKIFATWTPNPAHESIQLKAPAGTYTLTVINSLGEEIMTRTNVSTPVSIDISKLSAGIYFFRLDNGTAVQTNRILITE